MKLSKILNLVESSSKTDTSKSAYEFLKQYKNDESIFIRFTNTDTTEINTKTVHTDTPAGIYTYRLKKIWKTYKVDDNKSFIDLPFAAQHKLIQIFSYDGNNAPTISNDKQFTIEKLSEVIEKLKIKFKNYDEIISTRMKLPKLPGAQLLVITEKLVKKDFIAWSDLLVELGFHGLIDDGKKVIHPDEPQQAVFFKPEFLKKIKTIENISEYTAQNNVEDDQECLINVNVPGYESYKISLSPLSIEKESDNFDDALKLCKDGWDLPNTNEIQAIFRIKGDLENKFKLRKATYWCYLKILDEKKPQIANAYKGGIGSPRDAEVYQVRPIKRIKGTI